MMGCNLAVPAVTRSNRVGRTILKLHNNNFPKTFTDFNNNSLSLNWIKQSPPKG